MPRVVLLVLNDLETQRSNDSESVLSKLKKEKRKVRFALDYQVTRTKRKKHTIW